jgi:hypothetical protein
VAANRAADKMDRREVVDLHVKRSREGVCWFCGWWSGGYRRDGVAASQRWLGLSIWSPLRLGLTGIDWASARDEARSQARA